MEGILVLLYMLSPPLCGWTAVDLIISYQQTPGCFQSLRWQMIDPCRSESLHQGVLCDHQGLSTVQAQLFQGCSVSCLVSCSDSLPCCPWDVAPGSHSDSISCSLPCLPFSSCLWREGTSYLSLPPLPPPPRGHRSICSEACHVRPGRWEKETHPFFDGEMEPRKAGLAKGT